MSDATVDALNRLRDAELNIETAEGTSELEYAPDGSVWVVTRTRLAFSVSLDALRSDISFNRPLSQRHFRRDDGTVDVRAPGARMGIGVGMERGR